MDKGNANRNRSTKGKVATERVQMGRSRGKKKKRKGESYRGITIGVKLGIKEKRQEKGEEEGCMERKVHIGNKWCRIMTIYSEEMKTTRRRVEDAMKENREDRIFFGRGLPQENRRGSSKKLRRGEGGWEKKIQR
jgi:hypothetical protein